MLKDEALKKAMDFYKGDKIAAELFIKKYALRRNDGKYDEATPEQMWHRLAKSASEVEKDKDKWNKEFLRILTDFKAVPQGSILFALGNKYVKSSCSNCFVFEVKDSIKGEGGIMRTGEEMAVTYSYRGGCGLDLSPLRPAMAPAKNAALFSTGAASFMEYYSNLTRMIGMNGRRGALMLSMGIDHPDIEEFIKAKNDLKKITGANVSVRISDKFMKAVENNDEWICKFTISYQTDHHETTEKKFKARELWKLITESATKYAEPGVLFWDTILKQSPADCYADLGYKTVGTNPCSELPLEAYGACTLLSMNLTKYTKDDFTNKASFDESRFLEDVYVATRFLDNVKGIDAEQMPLPQQRKHALDSRRIGMGIHGLADCLANLCIKYDSDEGIKFISNLFEKYTKSVYSSSVELGKEKGVFPIFEAKREKGHPFLERIGFAGKARRNIACMTLAPTGTIALVSQASAGIEPVYAQKYQRKVKLLEHETVKPEDESKIVYNRVRDRFLLYDIVEKNAARYMEMFKTQELPEYFVSAYDINWKKRVEIQAAITKWLDHSCSSTVNLPVGTSSDIVGKIYMEAWKQGCKGITVYVDESREGIMTTGDGEEDGEKPNGGYIKRPKKVPCDIYQITADGIKWVVMIGIVNDKPYELFCGKPHKAEIGGKVIAGYIDKQSRGKYSLHVGEDVIFKDISDTFTDTQGALTRMISTVLRHGTDIKYIVQQLEKSDGEMFSFTKAISRVLKKYIKEGTKENGISCPECGGEMVRQEGCVRCTACGYSKCS